MECRPIVEVPIAKNIKQITWQFDTPAIFEDEQFRNPVEPLTLSPEKDEVRESVEADQINRIPNGFHNIFQILNLVCSLMLVHGVQVRFAAHVYHKSSCIVLQTTIIKKALSTLG